MTETAHATGIIVAVDGSPESTAALRWAIEDALLHNDPVNVVTVAGRDFYGVRDPQVQEQLFKWQRHRAERILQEALSTVETSLAGRSLPQIDTELVYGKVVPTLVDLSKDSRMIVVGRRGLGIFDRALAGSVSTGLVHHSHCPVAVIEQDSVADYGLPVLLGVDDSAACADAIALAFDEASRRRVELVAVHTWFDVDYVVPEFDWHVEKQYAHEVLNTQLDGWPERFPDVKLTRKIGRGNPGHWLTEHSPHAQLVVVGSHGRGAFAGMLLGSVSRALVHRSKSPVIVVRSS